MHFILKLFSLFVILGISVINAKTTYNETTPVVTNKSSETNGSLFEVEQYLQHKLESITDVLTQVDNSVKGLQEKAHTWAIFHHHIDAWNEQLKALEHKIVLLQRSHDEQQSFGDKLMRIELTLNDIYGKVLYLSDTCHNNQQVANAALQTQDGNILDLLQEMQDHDAGDQKAHSEILTRLANILHRLQNIESERCHITPQKRHHKAAATGEGRNSARLMLPVGSCNSSQRYDYNVNQSLKMLEQQLMELTASISPKDLKQMHALTKNNARILDDITHSLAETGRALEKCQVAENNQSRNVQEYCQSVLDELSDYSESSDILLKRIELIVGGVNEKLEGLSRQTGGDKVDHAGNEQRNNREVENNSVTNEPKLVERFDENDIDERFNSKENDTNIESEISKKTTEINFVQPEKVGCHELEERIDGIYKFSTPELNAGGRDFNERFCAFATEGLAWTVIQNRGPYSEQENFNRSWLEYRNGFGQLEKDFWFGTQFVHQLVYADDYELRIEMEDFDSVDKWAEYATFRLESESYNYNLLLSDYRGSVQDAMKYHNGMDFSTYDRRNDRSVDACCACSTGYGSGWWFDNCSEANLNGIYHDTPLGHNYVGIVWEQWHGDYSLKKARMLVRPKYSYDESESEIATQEIDDIAEDP